MQDVRVTLGRRVKVWVLFGSLLFAKGVAAEEDWGFDLMVYGWLPIIEFETESGEKGEITRDDLLDDLDLTAMWAARVRKGEWSLTTDFIYFKISDKEDLPLFPSVPGLAELREAGLQAWIITPNIGYRVHETNKQYIDLYAGGATCGSKSTLPSTLTRHFRGSRQAAEKNLLRTATGTPSWALEVTTSCPETGLSPTALMWVPANRILSGRCKRRSGTRLANWKESSAGATWIMTSAATQRSRRLPLMGPSQARCFTGDIDAEVLAWQKERFIHEEESSYRLEKI